MENEQAFTTAGGLAGAARDSTHVPLALHEKVAIPIIPVNATVDPIPDGLVPS